jgi:thymidine kinase
MKVIVGPRQSGKSTKLVELAAKNNLTIITFNHPSISYLMDIAKKHGHEIKDPVFADGKSTSRKFGGDCVIDEADFILEKMLGLDFCRVKAMSVCGVNGVDYDEQKDWHQFLDFQKCRDLTYQEFIGFKYGKKF